VSHELRTPLTPIIGYSEIMVRRPISGDKSREFAASILDSAKRLERIVAMLVDFSAIEGGRLSMDLQPVPLSDLLKESVNGWHERSPKHRFNVRAARSLPPALVSPVLFRRIVGELIDNAVKYSPGGGKVGVTASEAARGGRRMLEISVSDQGIGIEPDDLARIFQDFSQVDASDTRPFGGLGLGLTLVQRLVEAHGGSIEAESKPGKGSTFRFTVRAADAPRRKT
jgi:signal transduction histidine kinase